MKVCTVPIDDPQERIAIGLRYATPAWNQAEHEVAAMLFDELSNQWSGHGLSHEASGSGDDGRWVVVVSGSIDLVALARRALGYLAPDLEGVFHGSRDRE